jgi:TolB-like protein/tetratricopeptide (TPR) repeat protein
MPTAIRAAAPSLDKDSKQDIRQYLDRILASATFQQVDRLKRFVNFIVSEAIAGRGDQLKEYVIGVQVFGKEASFDPRTDPIVRVQARRLRARLARYYREEGQTLDVIIDLPKGGYVPVFKRREAMVPSRRSIGAALVSRNTVAVLPFSDHSQRGDLAYFSKGLRQEIIHRLAKLETLRVLASEPADFGGSDAGDPLTKLNAAVIVTGSLRQSGTTIRATTQLIDGASGCYLWSESVDAELEDTIGAQDSIARTIVGRFRPDLLQTGRGARRIENLAAHNLYLQGRYHLNQRTEEGLRKAVDFFEKAIVEDAQSALAHSGLSDAYGLLTHYGVLGPADVWAKAASSAATAVMLDGNSAEAHTSLAHMKSTQDWDWPGAEREFQRAISLDPRYPTAHHWYAMSCLLPMGRFDEALDEMLVAQSLDPVSSIIARDLAAVYFHRRDFDAALDQCDHTIELNPHFSPAYLTLGLIQEQRKDFDESAAAFQRAVHLSPQTPRMHGALARTFALSGKRKLALKLLHELERLAKDRYVSPFEFASIHLALGQMEVGFEWLERACQDRSFDLILIRVDPRFDTLREDPRFAAAVKRVGVE